MGLGLLPLEGVILVQDDLEAEATIFRVHVLQSENCKILYYHMPIANFTLVSLTLKKLFF